MELTEALRNRRLERQIAMHEIDTSIKEKNMGRPKESDILWVTVDNPKNHEETDALLTAGIDMDDGTCYVHSSLGSSKEKNFYMAVMDGNVKVINNNDNLYIDTSWMKEEYPNYIESLELIEKRLNEQKKVFVP